jgi:hypothetical protein
MSILYIYILAPTENVRHHILNLASVSNGEIGGTAQFVLDYKATKYVSHPGTLVGVKEMK